MSNRIKKLCYLLTFILSLLSVAAHATAEQYCTIADVREQAATGWHTTYSFNGRDIEVDVPLTLPDVESVPAVRVVHPAGLNPMLPENAELSYNNESGYAYSVMTRDNSGPAPGDREFYVEDGARAENSPLSPDEVAARTIELMEENGIDPTGMELDAIQPSSRYYASSERKNHAPVLNYDQPKSEYGAYYVTFRQQFQGVPYLTANLPFREPMAGKPAYSSITPFGTCTLIYEHDQEYAFIYNPAVFGGMVEPDLPLAPVEKVIAAFAERITSGYIRSVYEVEFGYVPFRDPADPDRGFLLLPVWLLRGGIVDEPRFDDPPLAEGSLEFTKKFAGQYAFVNAQTGEYIDPTDTSTTREYAELLTWAQVK